MKDRATILAFIALVLVSGANAVAVRASNAELPPFWGATLRLGGAAAIFWVFVAIRRVPVPRGRALVWPIAYGVISFGLSYALVYFGLKQAHAGTGQVTLALVPLLTLLFAVVQGQERFNARGLAGALVAAAGVALIFRDQLESATPLVSLLALLGVAALIAETGILIKRYPRVEPSLLNAIGMSVGAVLLAALSAVLGERWVVPTQPGTWWALGYLIVPGSVVLFTLVLRVLAVWSASRAAYQFLLAPLVTILVAATLVGEVPSGAFLIGGAIVLAGVYIGAFSGRVHLRPVRAAAAPTLEPATAPAYTVVPPPAGTC